MKKVGAVRKFHRVVLSFLLLACGCATTHTSKPLTPQEVDLLKARLGEIGVARAQYAPPVEVQTPSKGPKEGAQDGAVVGALAPMRVGVYLMFACADPYCLLLPLAGVVLAPIGAVIGAVGGAVTADPEEVVSEREAILHDATAALRPQEHMQQQFVSRLATASTFPFRELADAGPRAPEEKPDYRQFKDVGVKTVNEIAVRKLRITGWGKVKPNLSVRLEIQTRLVSTADNSELYCEVLTCSSGSYKFEEWAEHEAKQFLEQIDACYIDLANWAVLDIYFYQSILQMAASQSHHSPRQSTAKCE